GHHSRQPDLRHQASWRTAFSSKEYGPMQNSACWLSIELGGISQPYIRIPSTNQQRFSCYALGEFPQVIRVYRANCGLCREYSPDIVLNLHCTPRPSRGAKTPQRHLYLVLTKLAQYKTSVRALIIHARTWQPTAEKHSIQSRSK